VPFRSKEDRFQFSEILPIVVEGMPDNAEKAEVKHRILIVGQSQFGSLVDTYQYCRQLADRFDFTYV
jgi:hypothetical protein